jgi:hypothetical protein
MPRMSNAEECWRINPEGDKDDEDDEYPFWIVLYKFDEVKPHSRFWKNKKDLIGRMNGESVSKRNSMITTNRRGALAMARLVKMYGGSAFIFRGKKIEPDS